jgi:hypothetical protein
MEQAALLVVALLALAGTSAANEYQEWERESRFNLTAFQSSLADAALRYLESRDDLDKVEALFQGRRQRRPRRYEQSDTLPVRLRRMLQAVSRPAPTPLRPCACLAGAAQLPLQAHS